MNFGFFRYGIGHGLAGWRALMLAQQWQAGERRSRGERKQFQAAKLGRLFISAQNAPFWQKQFSKINITVLRSNPDEWLNDLPILQKTNIRGQGSGMLVGGALPRGAKWFSTGGSTGEPLLVVRDRATRLAGVAACIRGFSWLGVHPGAATVLVKSYSRVSLLGRLRCRLRNMELADPLGHDQGCGEALIRRLRDFHPVCFDGYPTSLLKLAAMARGEDLRVPVIFSTGEMLYSDQRRELEQVFAARVVSYYGSNEVNALTFECEHGRHHVTEEHVIMETVDEAGRPVWEKPGRILVTDLDNHAMPFIRYEIGDVGVLTREPCPCGRTLLVLKEFQGRQQDLLRNARGDVLPAIFFAGQFRELHDVRGYQLVQRQLDEINLNYVAAGPRAEVETAAIADGITRHLGAEMRVIRRRCDALPVTARGKTRLVIGLNA